MKYVIHRGITNKYIKENSYCAIKRALMDVNSSGVEFDIRLTKDNVIVLSHDSIDIESSNYSDIIKKKYLSTLDVILGINTLILRRYYLLILRLEIIIRDLLKELLNI